MTAPSLKTPSKEYARHQRGYNQSGLAVLLYDAIDNDDKCSRRAADLDFAASQQGNDESRNDSGDNTFFGRYSRGDTEGDSQWKCHDTYDDAGH